MFVLVKTKAELLSRENTTNHSLIVLLLLRSPVQFGVESFELLIIPLLKRAINNSFVGLSGSQTLA